VASEDSVRRALSALPEEERVRLFCY
jgi:hypothetical protein